MGSSCTRGEPVGSRPTAVDAVGSEDLSAAQERMWFLERLYPSTSAYNVTSAMRLRGKLDIDALRYAIETLVERHPALRSCFPLAGEKPRCETKRHLQVALERIDPELGWDEQGSDVAPEAVERFASRPFDLETGPLVRVGLMPLSAEDHLFVLVFHHLISDGWSLGILHSEIAGLYNGAVVGGSIELPPVGGDYAEYVGQERQRMEHGGLEEGLAFWADTLEGLEPLEMPVDRPRPALQTFHGDRHVGYLSLPALQRLEHVARDCSSSLFMVLHAAFAVLLHRYSGQDDVAIGSPVANRSASDWSGVVGLLVNTVVLRSRLEDDPTFEGLLARCRDSTLDAIEHSDVPFESVVDRIRPERSLSHNPLFQVMFALQGKEAELPAFEGLESTLLDPNLGSTRFDLECTTWRESERLKIRLTYSCDLFDDATAERMLGHYLRLLEQISERPKAHIGSFDLLSEDERQTLLPRGAALKHDALADDISALFDAQVERSPDAPALETASTSLTYRELQMAAERVAASLQSRGIGPEEVVAVRASREAEMVVAMLGVMKSGGALLPLDPAEPASRTRLLLADSGTRMVLTDDRVDAPLTDNVSCMTVAEAEAEGHKWKRPTPSADRLAYVIYTSGSSGTPKGVLVEHRNAVNTLIGCCEWFGFDSQDRFLCLASPTFDIFYFELLSPLLSGGSVRLVDRDELFDPARMCPILAQATVMQAVPSLMKQAVEMLQAEEATAPRMRYAITGGDAVPAPLPAAIAAVFPRAQVTVLYGPTEAAMVCAGVKLSDPQAVTGHPIGRPLPNVALRICDEEGGLVPAGVAGEICIGGPGVCRGYLDQSPGLAVKFIESEGERFYRSGDRGRWRNDGELEFLGRLDEQVKVRGFRIEPGEIEATLESQANVREAAVVACGDEESRRLVAFAAFEHSPAERQAAAHRHTEDWRALFDSTHASVAGSGEEHDFTGWHSSYTRRPLPREHMEEWLSGCVDEIRERLPPHRRGKARILEIGCGTGLVLLEMAGECDCYVGTDFSQAVLEGLRRRVRERKLTGVELHRRDADSIGEFEDGEFDVVIVNSVAQYLPDLEHLDELLARALRCLRPGGFVFVGDVRNFALHEPFLVGVEAAGGDWNRDELWERALQRRASERELLVNPTYFSKLGKEDGIAHVDVSLRWGLHDNELNRYRFNAVIYAPGGNDARSVREWVEWDSGEWSMAGLTDMLREGRVDTLGLASVSNALLASDLAEWARASGNGQPPPANPVHPGQLRRMARQQGYDVATSWIRGSRFGRFEIVLSKQRQDAEGPPHWNWPLSDAQCDLANDPAGMQLAHESVTRAEASVAERLPAYMIPSAISAVDALPTTPNGKVDRIALSQRGAALIRGFAAGTVTSSDDVPVSETEIALAKTWEEVLGAQRLSRHANFFSSGGTSLLAIRVAVRLRGRGIEVSAQDLFRHQTIAALAAAIERRNAEPVLAAASGSHRQPSSSDHGPHPSAAKAEGLPSLTQAKSILLTGATGFLGIHLLSQLLADTDAVVTCLVRGSGETQAGERLAEQWAWYFEDSEMPTGRVQVVAADLGETNLGLGQRTWNSLARESEHIVHAAADVRHVGEEEAIFRANLGGTRNVIELVAARRATSLHHVSTIGVKGVLPELNGRSFTERDLDIGQTSTEYYSASKLAAERAVRGLFKAGGIGTVLRVGTIAPHSVSGRFQRNGEDHFFLRYLRSTIELGLASHWPGRSFALAPVNLLATACIKLADAAVPGEETFHLTTPHLLSHYNVVQVLQALGYSIRLLDPVEFAEQVWKMASDRRYDGAVGGVLGLIDPPSGEHVPLDSSWTESKLQELGFDFPAPTAAWIVQFMEICIANGVLPAPLHWGEARGVPDVFELSGSRASTVVA